MSPSEKFLWVMLIISVVGWARSHDQVRSLERRLRPLL